MIYAIAPGYPFDKDLLARSQLKLLKKGIKIYVPSGIQKPYLFHSNSDEARLHFLLEAMCSEEVKIIWAIRGGYGSNRLISELIRNKEKFKKQSPKLLIGLSDITSLHLFWNQYLKWPALHGPVLEALGRDEFPASRLTQLTYILKGQPFDQVFKLKAVNSSARQVSKQIEAPVIGGNLTTLQSHIGTNVFPSLGKKILFLEDVGERGYRVDRMLQQFQQAGVLKGCLSVLVGEFVGGLESDGRSLVLAAIKRFASEVEIPVFSGIPSGHGKGYGFLPFGKKVLVKDSRLHCHY